MTDNNQVLHTALLESRKRVETEPDSQALRSIIAQVKYLLDLSEGRSTDRSRLDDIVVGVYAAREFETRDMDYAHLLYRVEEVAAALRDTSA